MKTIGEYKTPNMNRAIVRQCCKRDLTLPHAKRVLIQEGYTPDIINTMIEEGQIEVYRKAFSASKHPKKNRYLRLVKNNKKIPPYVGVGITHIGTVQVVRVINGKIEADQLRKMVCAFYNQPEEEILGRSRQREFVVPRHVICYLAKKHIKTLSLQGIGRIVGNRDHSSVIHACQSIQDLIDTDNDFKKQVCTLEGIIKSKIENS